MKSSVNKEKLFFVKKWFFSERFLSKFLEDDELKSVFWDFWEYYWEFWESNSTQPPHKWTLRIFLDECAEALSQLQVCQNCDFCYRFSTFRHLRPFKVSLLSSWPQGLEINCHYRLDFSLTPTNSLTSMRG